jgi:hypothetical protein
MPSRWKRGLSSIEATNAGVPNRLAVRQAAFRRAVALCKPFAAVMGLAVLAGSTGCDNAQLNADRSAGQATTRATGGLPVSGVASNPAVEAVNKADINDPAAASAALSSLAAVDTTDTDSPNKNFGAWATSLSALNYRQREALARGTRAASFHDLQARINALKAASETAGSSPQSRVDPLLRLALAEVEAGDALARDAAERDVDASIFRSDAVLLLDRVTVNTTRLEAIAGALQTLPFAAVEAASTGVAGSPEAFWGDGTTGVDGQPLKLPSMARHAAEVARLEKEITDLKAKQASLIAEQQAELKAADVEAIKAHQLEIEGRPELAYNAALAAAGHRLKASQLGLEAVSDPGDGSGVTAKLLAAQQDLRRLQAGQSYLAQVTEDAERRKARLDREKGILEGEATTLKASTLALLNGPANKPATRPSDVGIVDKINVATGLPMHRASDAPKFARAEESAALQKTIDAASTPAVQPTTRATEAAAALKDETGLSVLLGRAQIAAAEAQQLRDEAAKFYAAAAGHYDAAAKAADEATKALKERLTLIADPAVGPEDKPIKARIALLTPPQFIYRQADVKARQARLLADQALATVQQAVVRRVAEKTLDTARAVDPSVPATGGEVTALADAAAADTAVIAAYNAYRQAESQLAPLLPTNATFSSAFAKRKDALTTEAQLFTPTVPVTTGAAAPATQPAEGESASASPAAEVKLGEYFPDLSDDDDQKDNRDAGFSQAAVATLSHLKYAEAGLLQLSLWLGPNEDRKATAASEQQRGDVALAMHRVLFGRMPPQTPPAAAARVVRPPTLQPLTPGFRAPPPPTTAPAGPGGLFNGTGGDGSTPPADGSTPPADGSTPAPTPPPTDGSTPAPTPPPADGSTPAPTPPPTDGSTPAPTPPPADGSTPAPTPPPTDGTPTPPPAAPPTDGGTPVPPAL